MGIQSSVDDGLTRYFFDGDIMPGSEAVTYKPLNGSDRPIYAQVLRETITSVGEAPAASMVITVENNSTRGISQSELNASGDRISLAYRFGGTARTYQLGPTIDSDEHTLSFRVLGRGD